jgi:hypothetical protein
MGFFDKVGDALKKAGETGIKKIVETKDRHQIKMAILQQFTSKKLKELCKRYGGGPDDYEEDSWSGKRTRKKLIDSDFMNYAEWHINLEEVKAFALQNKIPISEILKEEKEREKKRKPEAELAKTAKNQSIQFMKVVDLMKQFNPSRNYKDEYGYHTELQGWLKAHFKTSVVEHTTGSSRPDIVIDGNIAIEVKGPTRSQDLKTIADKCNRYLIHYDHFAVILFNVEVNERLYQEWLTGINNRYPEVEIIRT